MSWCGGWWLKKACDTICKDKLKMGGLMKGRIQEYKRTGRDPWDGLEGEAGRCTDWHQAIPGTRWKRKNRKSPSELRTYDSGLDVALSFQKKGQLTQKWHIHHSGRCYHYPYYLQSHISFNLENWLKVYFWNAIKMTQFTENASTIHH